MNELAQKTICFCSLLYFYLIDWLIVWYFNDVQEKFVSVRNLLHLYCWHRSFLLLCNDGERGFVSITLFSCIIFVQIFFFLALFLFLPLLVLQHDPRGDRSVLARSRQTRALINFQSWRTASSQQGGTDLGFPEEELQVAAAQDAVVLDVAGQVHGAGAVHGAVHLHVAVDGVQVLLLVLREDRKMHLKPGPARIWTRDSVAGELSFQVPGRPSGHNDKLSYKYTEAMAS